MIHRHTVAILSLTSAILSFPATAYAQETAPAQTKAEKGTWRISTGVNYSQGDYGDVQDTKVISAPVAVRYRQGNFSVRVSLPYVSIDGPGTLLDSPQGRDSGGGGNSGSGSNSGSGNSGSGNSGSGGSGSGGSGSGGSGGSGGTAGGNVTTVGGTANRRSGIGDVGITLGYSFDLGETTYLDVTGRVKLPTASRAKRIGTGKADYTVGADLVQDIGNASIYIGGRRRFTGNPAGSALRDVWGAGGGASYRFAGGTLIGADYDWQQGSTLGDGASSEVTGWIGFPLSKRMRMQVYASTGFTTNSTDFAGGLSLSYRL
jgi:hypothetical protein